MSAVSRSFAMTNPMPHLHFTILNLRSTSTRSHSSPAVLSLFSGLSLFGAFQRRIRKPGSVLLAIVEILMVSVNLGRLSFRLKLLLACADTTFVRSPRSTDPDRFSPTSRLRLVLATYDLEDGIGFRSLYLTGLNRFMVSPLRLSHSSAYA